jgi:formylmethanofuran dehydrogenase subunit E
MVAMETITGLMVTMETDAGTLVVMEMNRCMMDAVEKYTGMRVAMVMHKYGARVVMGLLVSR